MKNEERKMKNEGLSVAIDCDRMLPNGLGNGRVALLNTPIPLGGFVACHSSLLREAKL